MHVPAAAPGAGIYASPWQSAAVTQLPTGSAAAHLPLVHVVTRAAPVRDCEAHPSQVVPLAAHAAVYTDALFVHAHVFAAHSQYAWYRKHPRVVGSVAPVVASVVHSAGVTELSESKFRMSLQLLMPAPSTVAARPIGSSQQSVAVLHCPVHVLPVASRRSVVASAQLEGGYPGWEPRPDSPLLAAAARA